MSQADARPQESQVGHDAHDHRDNVSTAHGVARKVAQFVAVLLRRRACHHEHLLVGRDEALPLPQPQFRVGSHTAHLLAIFLHVKVLPLDAVDVNLPKAQQKRL